ncbi:MAG: efflux RND transporter periplasmic adaptor subunit [Steroidobacteraceae bacterium]
MKFTLLTLAVILNASLVACSSNADEAGSTTTPTALVALATAKRGDVAQTVDIYGTAQSDASNQTMLAAPIEAVVARMVAPLGSAVHRGDVIVQLAPSPATSRDRASGAAAAHATKLALARALRLRADGLASDADVESARAAAKSAAAMLQSLSGDASSLTLRSPVDGYVQSYAVTPGDLIATGTSVAMIARKGDVRARFGVDPSLARRIAPGDPVTIVTAHSAGDFTVPVLSLDPVVDPQTRLAAVFVAIPSAAGVQPGETLRARVRIATASSQLTVPYAALLDDGGQPYVFSVRDHIAHRHDVVVGAISEDRAAIVSGLTDGAQVVIAGGTALEDGAAVRTE